MELNDLSPEQAQELRQLVEDINEQLRAAGAGSAEMALGLMIRMGVLPLLGIILLLFLFRVVNIIQGFVILAIATLMLLGISMLVSERARLNAMQQVFQKNVEKEILQFTHKYSQTRQQFDSLAYPLLPAKAPLIQFLSPAVGGFLELTREDENQERE